MDFGIQVSIIVPIYNIEKYIEKCIKSLIVQSYSNLEILLVNDGSTDGSMLTCNCYQEKDNRIKIINKKNGGLSSARNAGLKVARGKYYVFIDGDDYVHPEFIERLLRGVNESGADIAACGIHIVNEKNDETSVLATGAKYALSNPFNDEILQSIEVEKRYYKNRKYGFWYVVSWNKIYKAEIFDELKYDEGMIYEDEFLFHKLIRKSRNIKFIPDKLYYYVQRENGITSAKKSGERFHFLTEIYDSRMECYKRENNIELQVLCSEKYLRQIVSKFYLLDDRQKQEVKRKYKQIICLINVSWKLKLLYYALGLISRFNSFKNK